MPYADEELIPISALQHHLFCPRQCALIHVDGLWAENRLTVEGRALHERSDTPGRRTRRAPSSTSGTDEPMLGRRIVRALPLVARGLGLVGKADQVEFATDAEGRVTGPPLPVEHKRGRPKRLDHDRVQVAAQAMCLEEMLGVRIERGELFYHGVRRREVVELTDERRALVVRTAAEVRTNIEMNRIPRVKKQPKCRRCSLLDLCMPSGTAPSRSTHRYLVRSLNAMATETTSGEVER